MNVHYHCSDYISHRRAGQAYMKCFEALGHRLVDDPGESDLVVLHEEPPCYAATMAEKIVRPGGKYVGYAVWETAKLPRLFAEGVSLVDAVWTCSEFSREAFAPYAKTFVLPHVAERLRPTPRDVEWAMKRLGIAAPRRDARKLFYFYTIVDSVNPRKNISALLTAFFRAFPGAERNARLVVKQYREPLSLDGIPGVIDVPETLDDGKLSALHAVCDCYVSAHRAEAWGLPLSEALSMGNPVIATGYSGNMEFMSPENSFPIPYSLVPVSEAMRRAAPHLFSADMTWAEVDAAKLADAMRQMRSLPPSQEFRAQAAASMAAFSSKAIQERVRLLLELL